MSSPLVFSQMDSFKGDRRDEAMRQTPKMDGYRTAALFFPVAFRRQPASLVRVIRYCSMLQQLWTSRDVALCHADREGAERLLFLFHCFELL